MSPFQARHVLPGGSDGKESACNAGDLGSIPESGRSPGEGNSNPIPVFLPGEFHGQMSPVGYNPWGRKESDTSEQLTSLKHHHMLPATRHPPPSGPHKPSGKLRSDPDAPVYMNSDNSILLRGPGCIRPPHWLVNCP